MKAGLGLLNRDDRVWSFCPLPLKTFTCAADTMIMPAVSEQFVDVVDTQESAPEFPVRSGILVDTLVLQTLKSLSVTDLGPVLYPTRRIRSGLLRQRPCFYCGLAVGGTVDHVIPRALGGNPTSENCVPACRECNEEKQDYHPAVWLKFLLARNDPRAFVVATLLTTEQILTALPQHQPKINDTYQCWPGLDEYA